MSNKSKWSKSIKFKQILKKDKLFKSYWIRKFLNKLTKLNKLNTMELILYRLILKLKVLKVKVGVNLKKIKFE